MSTLRGRTSLKRTLEVALLFAKLGLISFGGPAAHIALMRHEAVVRRRWLDDEHFLDLLGATNLIPGPNATEMAIHIGYTRAGWPGLIVGGTAFIVPAMVIVLALAWAYVRFGTVPQVGWLLYGIKPIVLAIVMLALRELGKRAVHDPLTVVASVGTCILYFLKVNEVALLFGSGLLVTVARNWRRLWNRPEMGLFLLSSPTLSAWTTQPFSLTMLFLIFFKIGALLYGSGYVLLAFLRADLVERLGWVSEQQLLDAIAVGQLTPGPVLTTATFIGYLLAGVPGGLLATLAIFLPSFMFVALTNPLIPRLRHSTWASTLLDGVNAAALGLMTAVTLLLGRASIVDLPTAVLAVLGAVLLWRWRINAIWLMMGGAVAGLVCHMTQL